MKEKLLLIMLILLTACDVKHDTMTNIPIDPSIDSNSGIDYTVFTQSVDSVVLEKGEIPLSRIRKACVNDSLIFILDDMKSLFVYNTKDGHLIKQIQRVGHGAGEYIEPMSVSIDGEYLYVLDMAASLILKYDYSLNYQGQITIPIHTFDFIKVPDGFLLWNAGGYNDLKSVLHVDLEGTLINTYVKPKMELDHIESTCVFSDDGEGRVYALETISDTIYEWKNNQMTALYGLDFGVESDKDYKLSSEKKAAVGIYSKGQSFVAQKYVFTPYINNDYTLINVYDRLAGKSYCGTVKTPNLFPFIPVALHKNNLYAISDKMLGNEPAGDYDIVLLKYHLK
ncbi:MAG: 6-bladed beta-propeller [Bacteroidaceae bacterium]|nr:6-bladed beta-propeller [Bacteroidaceae bacterium]